MQHQRRRRLFFLRISCSCGEQWPCPDSIGWPETVPIPDGTPTRPSPYNRASLAGRHAWDSQTAAYSNLGRAGRLTPAQSYRANGGRW